MSEHISEPDKDGNIKIWWDTPEEDPTFGEKGQAIELLNNDMVVQKLLPTGTDEFDLAAPAIISKLHRLARMELGPDVVYDIRGKIPNNYGRGRGLAWYSNRQMQTWPVTGAIPYPGTHNKLGGYMVLGTFKT